MGDGGQRTPVRYGKVIAAAWREPAFKAKPITDPQDRDAPDSNQRGINACRHR